MELIELTTLLSAMGFIIFLGVIVILKLFKRDVGQENYIMLIILGIVVSICLFILSFGNSNPY